MILIYFTDANVFLLSRSELKPGLNRYLMNQQTRVRGKTLGPLRDANH